MNIRADLIDLYIFRRTPHTEFLQLQRREPPLEGTWQPIMGHIEPNETAAACAARELHEETGLSTSSPALLGLRALQEVHPYFIARLDAIMLTPRFAAEVTPDWQPTLNHEHTAARWIPLANAPAAFMWPGQRRAIDEIIGTIIPGGPAAEIQRLFHT